MGRGIGQLLLAAPHFDLVALGIGLIGAAAFYLFVELLRYPLAHTPALGKSRPLRFGLIVVFLLCGAALIPYGYSSASDALFRRLPILEPFGIVVAPLLLLNLLLLLRNALDEIRRAIAWRRNFTRRAT